jgi:radical SAM protein with 4Fe4S-binding SPASM domain
MSVAVSPDGAVFPCHRFAGDYRYSLGKISGDGQVEPNPQGHGKFADAYRIVQESCKGCYARRFCAGNCLHVAVQRLDHGLPPHDEDECNAIRAGVIGALRAVVRHVDPDAAVVPRVLDRRILNKACKVAFFSAQRMRGTRNGDHR